MKNTVKLLLGALIFVFGSINAAQQDTDKVNEVFAMSNKINSIEPTVDKSEEEFKQYRADLDDITRRISQLNIKDAAKDLVEVVDKLKALVEHKKYELEVIKQLKKERNLMVKIDSAADLPNRTNSL